MKSFGWMLLVLVGLLGSEAVAQPQGFGAPAVPEPVLLKKERVSQLLKMIPELAKATVQYQGQFLSSMGGASNPSALPRIPEAEMQRLEKIYAKYGFTLQEFIGELSVMIATYFALDKDAFAATLPSEDKPEIKAMLEDPALSAEQKAQLRQQIKIARENQSQLRAHLMTQTNEANMGVLRPLLPRVRAVFKEVQQLTKDHAVKSKNQETGKVP